MPCGRTRHFTCARPNASPHYHTNIPENPSCVVIFGHCLEPFDSVSRPTYFIYFSIFPCLSLDILEKSISKKNAFFHFYCHMHAHAHWFRTRPGSLCLRQVMSKPPQIFGYPTCLYRSRQYGSGLEGQNRQPQ